MKTEAARRRVRRLTMAGLLAVVVMTGLVVHSALPDTSATDIAGDALYALAVYLFVAILAPRVRALAVGGIAAAWCVAVELFQLTGLPLAWGAQFGPVMLLLGTVFDARDLVVYVAAVAIAAAADTVLSRKRA